MATYDDLLARLKTLERLLTQAKLREYLPHAHSESVSIARDAPTPGIAELAAKVVAEINELKRKPDDVRTEDIPVLKALLRLRLALRRGAARESDEAAGRGTITVRPSELAWK